MTSFANYVESQYPAGLDVDKDDLVDHASAVALLGDAKAVRQSSHHGVFLRSIKRHITIRRPDTDALLPVGELTAIAGGASIVLADGIVWEFAGTVATIENAETFWRYEQVLPNVDLAIFTQGRMSERKLAWLASSLMAEARYIHWGDYDPVGITEYLRLLAACPDRVQMYCPPNLEELLSKFGKPALITEQTKTLDSLRDSHDNTVQKLVTLFDRYGRGLEQELLLKSGEYY